VEYNILNGRKKHIVESEVIADQGEFVEGFTLEVLYELLLRYKQVWCYWPHKTRSCEGKSLIKLGNPLVVDEAFMKKMLCSVLNYQ
jgi:hypothetical protein